ncbi:MAG: replicative DNA helicase [bacterium]
MRKQAKASKELDRMPPYDETAEKAVIASIFRNNEIIHDIIPILKPEDFFKNSHRIIYSSILNLYENSCPFDVITVKNQLEKQGDLDKIGGGLGLSEVLEGASIVTNAVYHARIVKEKSRLRNLISAAQDMLANCYLPDQESDQIIDTVEQKVFELSDQMSMDRIEPISTALAESFTELKDTFESGSSGMKTGFMSFDNLTGGLHRGDLIVIAGRPAMGKTTFGMNIAEYVAHRYGMATLIFSLEMVRAQVALRLLSSETQIELQRLRKGEIQKKEWDSVAKACEKLGKLPIYIDDTPDISVLEMKSVARRLSKRKPLGLIMVDYIQMVRGEGKPETRQLEISQISRSLKFLAKDLNCPVMALSQLSRAVENRPAGKKRPLLSDLRESGAIEQDADLVVMLYRPFYYNETEVEIESVDKYGKIEKNIYPSKGLAEIIIAKQRNGPTGSFWLGFQDSFTQFINMETQLQAPTDIAHDRADEWEVDRF